jgi:hypothetical protein
MESRRAPQRALLVHSADDIVGLVLDSGVTTTAAGLPPPIGPKAAPMPPDHGLGFDDRDRIQKRGEQSVHLGKDQPVDVSQPAPANESCASVRSPCRRTMFSASSLARDFSLVRATSSSLIRNSTIWRSSYHSTTARSSWIRFSVSTRKRFGHLARQPACGWMLRDIEANNLPAVVGQDEHHKQ